MRKKPMRKFTDSSDCPFISGDQVRDSQHPERGKMTFLGLRSGSARVDYRGSVVLIVPLNRLKKVGVKS